VLPVKVQGRPSTIGLIPLRHPNIPQSVRTTPIHATRFGSRCAPTQTGRRFPYHRAVGVHPPSSRIDRDPGGTEHRNRSGSRSTGGCTGRLPNLVPAVNQPPSILGCGGRGCGPPCLGDGPKRRSWGVAMPLGSHPGLLAHQPLNAPQPTPTGTAPTAKPAWRGHRSEDDEAVSVYARATVLGGAWGRRRLTKGNVSNWTSVTFGGWMSPCVIMMGGN
jgi:hypothetical protein